jgi:hypothetical protein
MSVLQRSPGHNRETGEIPARTRRCDRGRKPPNATVHSETFEKCSFLFEFKEGENFNHRYTSSISRIKI